jgi:hypothetical protein
VSTVKSGSKHRLLPTLRAVCTLFVLVSQFVVATARHHHSTDLAESWLSDDASVRQEIHEINCLTPNAIHWHADKTIEVEPCLACLRQHLAGVEVAIPLRIVVPAITILAPGVPRSPFAGFILDASSRGPPAVV